MANDTQEDETNFHPNSGIIRNHQASTSSKQSLDPEDDAADDSSLIEPGDRPDKFQKWRMWWSRKKRVRCIALSNSSDSSDDSDDDYANDDGFDSEFFTVARCRLRRIIGKLTTVYEGVEGIFSARYGPLGEGVLTSFAIPDREKHRWITDSQWEKATLLNTVDILQSRISAVRKLFATYRMKMPNNRSDDERQSHNPFINDCRNDLDDVIDVAPTRFPLKNVKTPSSITDIFKSPCLAKRRGQVVNFTANFKISLNLLCSLFMCIIQPISLYTGVVVISSVTSKKPRRERLIDRAFGGRKLSGLQDCLEDDEWKVFEIYHPCKPGIVERCVTPPTSSSDPIRAYCNDASTTMATPSTMISENLEILAYFRNTAILCAYVFKRLKGIERELALALKTLGEMKDRRIRNCKPYSDRREMLRRVVMKGEMLVEIGQIACTSASPEECHAKRFMVREILRIEKKADAILQRYVSWKRCREFPVPRGQQSNRKTRTRPKKKAAPAENRVLYKRTSSGLIVRRFYPIDGGRSLVQRAFGGQSNVGLNIFSMSNFK